MNKDKAIQLLERLQDPEPYEPILTKDAYDAIQMAIDALSADGDTISRTSLMSELKDMHHEAEKWIADAKNDDVKARAESCLVTITEIKLRVDKMPSVQPEPSQVAADIARIVENGKDMRVIGHGRIRGRWIIRETSFGDTEARCSHCGFTTLVDEPGNGLHMVSDLNFCPNCWAKMEVTE